jgi:hypothetical protein
MHRLCYASRRSIAGIIRLAAQLAFPAFGVAASSGCSERKRLRYSSETRFASSPLVMTFGA